MNIKEISGLLFIVAILNTNVYAQNRNDAQQVIVDLCSREYAGRGYLLEGDKRAANYISNKFADIGLTPISENYLQEFIR